MIKFEPQNIATIVKKVVEPTTKSVTLFSKDKAVGGALFGNNSTTQEMKNHFATKLENLAKELPEKCGELFVKIV